MNAVAFYWTGFWRNFSQFLLSNIHIAVTAMQWMHRHARACFKMVLYVSGKTGQVRNTSPKRCCNAATSALWACVTWLSQWSEDGIVKFGTSGPNLFLSLNRFTRDGFSLSLCFQEAQMIWFVWLAWFGHKSDAGLRAIYLPVKIVWVVNVVKSLLTFLGLEQILPWQPAQHWRTSPQMSSY